VRDLSGPHDLPGVAVGRLNLRGTNGDFQFISLQHLEPMSGTEDLSARVRNGSENQP
jgi:hypothetical protein